MATPNGAQPLAPAPAGELAPPPDLKVTSWDVSLLVLTAEGFEVEVTGRDVPPREIAPWINSMSKNLEKSGLKPVSRTPVTNVSVAAPAPSAPAAAARVSAAGGGESQKRSKYAGEIFKACPRCDGAIYDNRQKKDKDPRWRGPWFKCRDADDCGWAVFKNDGTDE